MDIETRTSRNNIWHQKIAWMKAGNETYALEKGTCDVVRVTVTEKAVELCKSIKGSNWETKSQVGHDGSLDSITRILEKVQPAQAFWSNGFPSPEMYIEFWDQQDQVLGMHKNARENGLWISSVEVEGYSWVYYEEYEDSEDGRKRKYEMNVRNSDDRMPAGAMIIWAGGCFINKTTEFWIEPQTKAYLKYVRQGLGFGNDIIIYEREVL